MAGSLSDLGGALERLRQREGGSLPNIGARQAAQLMELLRSAGNFVAPNLISYFTEPETPYSKRLQAAGGTIGPQGELVAPPSGKVPEVQDPRALPAAAEAFDLASSLVPVGGAAKGAALAAALVPGAKRVLKPSMLKPLTGENAAQEFYNAVKAAKEAHPQGAAVTLKDVKDYAKEGVQLVTTKDKTAGYAIMPDGDVVSVFKHPNAPYSGAGPVMAAQAIEKGGKKLDAYDTVLPDMYTEGGFGSVARLPFDPKQAPPDWDKAAFSAFSGKTPNMPTRMKDYRIGGEGEPDIVGMVANPPGPVSDVATNTYGNLMTLQDLAAAGRHPARFITNPTRSIFPGIYGNEADVAAEAARRVAPEDPLLHRLFGVHRGDIEDIAKAREKEFPGLSAGNLTPPTIAPTRGSEAAVAKIMTPENMQRYVNVLTEARKYPGLMQGGYGWYIQDPLFEHMSRVVGPEQALRDYPVFTGYQGSHSPGSNVLTEIHRGTTAYQALRQGWLPEYIQYGNQKKGVEVPADIAAKLLGVPGHLAHGAQTFPLEAIAAGRAIDTPKTTPYTQAAGVPQTGFSWNIPAFDAMMARSIGLTDVRTPKTLNEIQGSLSPAEVASVLPYWRDITAQAGMNPVGGQGVGWTAFGPQTGVKTLLGAPKLELQAMQIGRRSRELEAQGIKKSPEQIRDEGLAGMEHWLVPLIGPAGIAGYLSSGSSGASPEL